MQDLIMCVRSASTGRLKQLGPNLATDAYPKVVTFDPTYGAHLSQCASSEGFLVYHCSCVAEVSVIGSPSQPNAVPKSGLSSGVFNVVDDPVLHASILLLCLLGVLNGYRIFGCGFSGYLQMRLGNRYCSSF